ncbi:hypothetical protein EV363DRAFT_1150353 [Boletus edulis]|nr:hypothetical protein EV363DRAFT_1150353 [Boletus edulis]
MHHALQLQEILLNIFGHHYPGLDTSDLAALARTCRAFKEPALDVLWEDLNDLSPLLRCVPEASRQISSGLYGIRRPLTQIEWDILRSYTRRIRSIFLEDAGINEESVVKLSKPPTIEPFLSNVRKLRFDYTPRTKLLSFHHFPSLVSLDIQLKVPLRRGILWTFSKFSPSLTELYIESHHPVNFDISGVDPRIICHWRNLWTVWCSGLHLDVVTLVHLSRMPALTCLGFAFRSELPDEISPSFSPLIFSNLKKLMLCSGSLDPIFRLVAQTRYPAVTNVSAFITTRPSRRDLPSFFTGVKTSGSPRAIQGLSLVQERIWTRLPLWEPVLGLEDLQLYTPFSNLRRINLSIDWKVNLTDDELLSFASAWPLLEELLINMDWGWKTLGGITPNGLLQVLQICRSLTRIALAIDTRGYTDVPPSPASLGLTLPRLSFIDVLDSDIEEESVPAITAFIAGLILPSEFEFRACHSYEMDRHPPGWNRNVPDCQQRRWKGVYDRVKDAVSQLR